MSIWLLDASLVALIVALAFGALYNPDIRAAVALYIAFGLTLALTWARFGAVDLALAEAAIGAGLTGALMLSALAGVKDTAPVAKSRPWRGYRFFIPGFGVLLLMPGWGALSGLPLMDTGLPAKVAESLDDSGVSHPVTAVLLNFRAWDTLLELLVVLLAVVGMRQAGRTDDNTAAAPWPVLVVWSRLLAPLVVVAAGYVLWRGATAPGGAFQAGALLAAGAVVLRFSGLLPPLRWSHWAVRGSVLLGVAIFLLVGLMTLASEGIWLAYPLELAGALIIGIEVAATWSIAVSLTLLVVGEQGERPS